MEETNLPNVDLSLLEQDLSGVDTSMPLIKGGLHDLVIAEAKLEPSKDGAKTNLNLTLKTTMRAETTKDGIYVESGWPVYRTISLTPTEKYSADQIRRNLAEVTQAAGVPSIMPTTNLIGKVVRCKVSIENERRDKATGKLYPPKNEIDAFIKPGI